MLAILNYIKDLKDLSLALNRLETPTKYWSLEELEKELDLREYKTIYD